MACEWAHRGISWQSAPPPSSPSSELVGGMGGLFSHGWVVAGEEAPGQLCEPQRW